MKRHLLLAAFLLILAVWLRAEEPVLTKAFTVKFKKVNEVASLINGMLSENGAITLQPRLRTIVVQDYASNLRNIEMAIADFDTAPPSVEISIKLVLAQKSAGDSSVSNEIKSMAKIGEVLRFNHYSVLDTGVIQSEEGRNTTLSLAKDYQLQFVTDVIQEKSGTIRLKNFQLKKRKKEANGKDAFVTLLSVTINLQNAETLILGASRFEESDHALLIILLAKVKNG
jgi:type II secretory pathway component GspD/PulD (secretin)